jgi:hypothetical protein
LFLIGGGVVTNLVHFASVVYCAENIVFLLCCKFVLLEAVWG